MKRFIAFALVLVLVLSLVATSFAAKPSVSLSSKQKKVSIKRGKSYTFTYKLNCGSYKKKSGRFRAFFKTIAYSKVDPTYGMTWPRDNYVYAFTGKGNKKVKFKVPSYFPTGAYAHQGITGTLNSNGTVASYKIKNFKLTVK